MIHHSTSWYLWLGIYCYSPTFCGIRDSLTLVIPRGAFAPKKVNTSLSQISTFDSWINIPWSFEFCLSSHHLPGDSAQFKLFWCLLLDKKSPGPDALFQQVIDKTLCLHLPFRRTRRLLITFRTSLLIAFPIGDLRRNPVTTTEHCLCLRFFKNQAGKA